MVFRKSLGYLKHYLLFPCGEKSLKSIRSLCCKINVQNIQLGCKMNTCTKLLWWQVFLRRVSCMWPLLRRVHHGPWFNGREGLKWLMMQLNAIKLSESFL